MVENAWIPKTAAITEYANQLIMAKEHAAALLVLLVQTAKVSSRFFKYQFSKF